MRWNFGTIYKKIRESKGMTQSQVCGSQLSRTSLAKIEANLRVPSFENMIFLLNQLDMRLEEFEYICDFYNPNERQKILNILNNHNSINDISELENAYELCQNYLKTNHDIPIEHAKQRLELVIQIRKNGLHNSEHSFKRLTKLIWKYLEKQDTWYFSDLQLLNTVLHHFPIDTLPNIVNRILASLEKYENFKNIQDIQIAILFNASTIFLYEGYPTRCEELTKLILNLAKKGKQYDKLALANVRLGICLQNVHLINKGIQLLTLTEEHDLLKQAKKEVDTFLKK
ncbi:helix-turn-helix domain-containing protein [Streptococcus saliviloxodontae]|uniref:Transcriptional regulator with XRE-family HTH domain n=1 Tax=Streptococcus saliviloxodontae TaxID=1349416 RepID=A0ABS2PNM5_9STRE|nr:transcriptional regulator with XRE-family HTH domain [Streptococcus saliviloxodontae]